MKGFLRLVLPSVVVLACSTGTESYYAQEGMVSISGVDVDAEDGNVGGTTVNIIGKGFGTDPMQVTVLFGNHNAKVVSVDDTNLTVVSPVGPVSGGLVDIKVGTAEGQFILAKSYAYKLPGNVLKLSG